MNKEAAIKEVKNALSTYLMFKGIETDPYKKWPCLNPEHDDKQQSMKFIEQENVMYCEKCGVKYNTLDIVGLDFKLTDEDAQLEQAASLLGVRIDK